MKHRQTTKQQKQREIDVLYAKEYYCRLMRKSLIESTQDTDDRERHSCSNSSVAGVSVEDFFFSGPSNQLPEPPAEGEPTRQSQSINKKQPPGFHWTEGFDQRRCQSPELNPLRSRAQDVCEVGTLDDDISDVTPSNHLRGTTRSLAISVETDEDTIVSQPDSSPLTFGETIACRTTAESGNGHRTTVLVLLLAFLLGTCLQGEVETVLLGLLCLTLLSSRRLYCWLFQSNTIENISSEAAANQLESLLKHPDRAVPLNTLQRLFPCDSRVESAVNPACVHRWRTRDGEELW